MSITEFTEQMVVLLPKVIRLLARRQSNELLRGKLTLPQFLILEFLYKENSAIMSKIANVLSISPPAATGIVDKLVRDGYLVREYDQNNRRIIWIKLTSKGKRIVEEVIKQRRDLIKNIFGKLTEKERQEYLNIFTKIYKNLLGNGKSKK